MYIKSGASYFGSFFNGGIPRVNAGPEPTMEGGWLRGDVRFRVPMMQLHEEIVEFCDHLSPTKSEVVTRDAAVESVSGVVKSIWPNCKVEVFGSFKTGLFLPNSDIDLVILRSGVTNLKAALRTLSMALSQEDIAKEIEVIGNARVPIIKFKEKRSGISFDISFNCDNGPKAAIFVKEAIWKWPPLRPLCLILKIFLRERGYNEVYSGGIGSYALLIMLIAMLQDLRKHLVSPECNLGVLLIQFFFFYGRLDTMNVGVCCGGSGTFSKRSKGFMNHKQPFLLSIEDPQAPENDIGKNSFNYFQIKLAFERAFWAMTSQQIMFGPNRSILGTIIQADVVLLERKRAHNVDSMFRSLMHECREPLQSHYCRKEISRNWPLVDEQEALTLGHGGFESGSTQSSSKKRKTFSEEKRNQKKLKENGTRK